jgi:CTP synthase
MLTKYIFVTGGVLSGVGKGITAASIGNLLKARGLKVNIQKCDPYLNFDAGTLNPGEHGECFVTHDGSETDLDLGHYERFLDSQLDSTSSLMSGRVLGKVIADERAGKYLGKTVQIIPHVTTAIQQEIIAAAKGYDVHIVEIGGTVGDYESLSFIESIRELGVKLGSENAAYVHVVYLPYLGASGELKTKPAQNAVRELRGLGIVPDVLVARSESAPNKESIDKLSLFCGVNKNAIVSLPNAKTIYSVPITLEESGIADVLLKRLDIKSSAPDLTAWKSMLEKASNKDCMTIKIGMIAKYLNNQDTYMSVVEALKSAAWNRDLQVKLIWIDAEAITDQTIQSTLDAVDGIIVLGGFGSRGVEGKILAADFAAKNGLPYLGICLGLQTAVIAFARANGLTYANSTEINPSVEHKVISTMADQLGKEGTGGSMRLGDYPAVLTKGSLAAELYGETEIVERHRHRYECSPEYTDQYISWGLNISGVSPDGKLVEFVEMPKSKHPFFIATQAHPEFLSRPTRAHPLFLGLIDAVHKRII